jgi:hypothetical protein
MRIHARHILPSRRDFGIEEAAALGHATGMKIIIATHPMKQIRLTLAFIGTDSPNRDE